MRDPRLDELWQTVMGSWGSDAAHSAFLEHCRATRQLGEACSRYRDQVRRGSAYRDDPTRSETAQKRLDGIVTVVMMELQASGTPREEVPAARAHRVVRWAAGLFFLAALGFLLFQMVSR